MAGPGFPCSARGFRNTPSAWNRRPRGRAQRKRPTRPWPSAGSATPRTGRQELFRQSYEYAPRAVGLRGVPIQVWTTKGFQADWAAPLDTDKPPIENHLRHPPGRPDDLIGNITSHLPIALEDVLMIYRGEVAGLGPAPAGHGQDRAGPDRSEVLRRCRTIRRDRRRHGRHDLRLDLLFHEAWTAGQEPSNGSLRDLDQSWRLTDDNRDEVILVGRLPQAKGQAEDMTKASGVARPAVAG